MQTLRRSLARLVMLMVHCAAHTAAAALGRLGSGNSTPPSPPLPPILPLLPHPDGSLLSWLGRVESAAQHVHLQEVHKGVQRVRELLKSLVGEAKYLKKRLNRHAKTTVRGYVPQAAHVAPVPPLLLLLLGVCVGGGGAGGAQSTSRRSISAAQRHGDAIVKRGEP